MSCELFGDNKNKSYETTVNDSYLFDFFVCSFCLVFPYFSASLFHSQFVFFSTLYVSFVQIQCKASIHNVYQKQITQSAFEERPSVYSPSLSYLSEEEFKLMNSMFPAFSVLFFSFSPISSFRHHFLFIICAVWILISHDGDIVLESNVFCFRFARPSLECREHMRIHAWDES